jgi:hypothetical protein
LNLFVPPSKSLHPQLETSFDAAFNAYQRYSDRDATIGCCRLAAVQWPLPLQRRRFWRQNITLFSQLLQLILRISCTAVGTLKARYAVRYVGASFFRLHFFSPFAVLLANSGLELRAPLDSEQLFQPLHAPFSAVVYTYSAMLAISSSDRRDAHAGIAPLPFST